jgi:hypothetical protein
MQRVLLTATKVMDIRKTCLGLLRNDEQPSKEVDHDIMISEDL